MNLTEAEEFRKEERLVLYQDEIYAIIDVDPYHNRVMIEKANTRALARTLCAALSVLTSWRRSASGKENQLPRNAKAP
ncbi:MAG: hypothetical protein ACLSH6_01380 [Limosilactobacillus pontis]